MAWLVLDESVTGNDSHPRELPCELMLGANAEWTWRDAAHLVEALLPLGSVGVVGDKVEDLRSRSREVDFCLDGEPSHQVLFSHQRSQAGLRRKLDVITSDSH